MMLNSKSNYKRLLLALVCGSMSYSTWAKVYSWRDAGGAMHYSQFPRQIVEKNAAQSRASRKHADMNDVVNALSVTPKVANLLDGLDDIIANANIERQIEKVLTRRDPQLILIEQQLARQQAEQQALLVAKQQVLKQQIIEQQRALAAVKNAEINRGDGKSRLAKNSFMARVHKRVYGHGNSNANSNDVIAVVRSTSLLPTPLADLNSLAKVEVKQPRQATNKFLAGIQSKLKRQRNVTSTAAAENINAVVMAKLQAVAKSVIRPLIAAKPQSIPAYILEPVDASRSIAIRKPKANFNNVFLAGIKRKVNRKQAVPVMDKPVILASQNNARVARNIASGQPLPATAEQVQNKFLAEINKKRFRTHLAIDNTGADNKETDSRGIDNALAGTLVKAHADINASSRGTTTTTTRVKNNELIQGAEQIKAIENEISNSRQSNKVKTPSTKQVNSALMLSRLSYHPQAHLPLLGAGINQLDIQGIDASSQFVNEVNSNAE